MLIKLFRSGKGGGAAPVDYLIASHVLAYDGNRDLIRDDTGVPLMKNRDPLPEVLAGDPDHTRALIDACPHAWTYRAGVISFDKDDHPTEEQQQAVMDAFDELAFAGLDRDQVDMLWVRHSHEGRVELHFCTPRMELTSGKSLNIAPPGYQKAMDALRDMLNKEHGWADPQDPARSQDTKQLPEKKLRAQGREDIQNWLEDLIVAGRISSRPDMIAALEGAGFELPRQGKTYLTVKDPDSDTRWRLKGDIFHADWIREKTAQRAAEREHRAGAPGSERLAARSLSDLRDEYRAHVEKRRLYNQQRYPLIPGETERDLRKALEVERGTDPSAENQHGRKREIGREEPLAETVGSGPGLGRPDPRRDPVPREPLKRRTDRLGLQSDDLHGISGPDLQHQNRHISTLPGHSRKTLLPADGIELHDRHQSPLPEPAVPTSPDAARARVAELGRTLHQRLRTFDRSAGALGKALDRLAGRAADRARDVARQVYQLATGLQRGLARLAQCAGILQQIGGRVIEDVGRDRGASPLRGMKARHSNELER
ncbi:relaxase/mobilization nuclease domain-containing protein [Roseibium aggregatum]|uniref:relaxase/mobilization nuclease domain-containing protein n=1 Tax=Roseibium aggregatum TaxID=187304 RepID=UPI001E497D73|nr:relaxase/mobilization nuclease domain-containing protein [Roseibium aggregatum]UES46799.1 relaxase/mobilization nuclease domain-containing protein [Roseibium aggregatum]